MFEQRLILNRYRIIGKAGAGGYATVQHAFDTRLKRDVAIKCIPLSKSQALSAQPHDVHASRAIRNEAQGAYDAYGEDLFDEYYDDEYVEYEEVMPVEPSFLKKKEERAAMRAAAKRQQKSRYGDRGRHYVTGGVAQSRPLSTVTAARAMRTSKNSYAVNTADIAKLAGQLPGVISGAGHTKIAGIDDAVDIDASLMEGAATAHGSSHSSSRSGIGTDATASDEVSGFVPIPSFLDRQASKASVGAATSSTRGNASLPVIAPISSIDAPLSAHPSASGKDAARQRGQVVKRTRIKDPDFIQMHAQAAKRAASGFDDIAAKTRSQEPLDDENIPGLEEARTAAHLNDANIVTVYDCVVEDGMAYVIMEYVEGKTLARVMKELENDITLDMITSVFLSVSHALQVAHKAGVLHLDIKPENVVINKEGVVKVTDFGLSALMDASGQGTTGGGTIGYMPLEQMRQQPLDVRTDEWALASLTYEMLSGVNPFRARTLEGAAAAIENAELILPSVCWDVEEEIDDVMFIALDPDLDQRYSNVKDFAEDLKPFLGSAKDGKKQLADVVVNGVAVDDVEFEDEPSANISQRTGQRRSEPLPQEPKARAYKVPFVDKLGNRGMDIVMRIVAVLATCMMNVISMMNFRFGFTGPASSSATSSAGFGAANTGAQNGLSVGDALSDPRGAAANIASNIVDGIGTGFTSSYTTMYGDASIFGLFSIAPVVAWALLAVFAVVTFIRPRFGMPLSYLAFFVMLVFNQAWTSAFLILVATGAWWWFFGRSSDLECTVVLLQPLFGSVGFASIVAVVAGAFLDVKQALFACIMAGISAIVFASLGSGDVMNWAVYSNFIVAINPSIAGPSIMNGLIATLTTASNLCVIASWLVGAVLFALLCWKGTRSFDILGSVACGACILFGILFMPVVIGVKEPLSALQIAGSLVPAVIGVVLALMSVPDRVRTDYDLPVVEPESTKSGSLSDEEDEG